MEPLKVPISLDYLPKIRQHLTSAAKEAGLEKRADKLRLAVDEIAKNIITHGYEEAGLVGNIYLQTEINEKNLTVYIEDTGIAYDPTKKEKVTEETLQKKLEERSEGELGVFLVRDSVDEFRYERVADRNRNILIVNRTIT